MNVPDFLTEDECGEVRLAGHRIGLYTVVRLYRAGQSAEQIAAEMPSLPLALIDKTRAFYLENQAEVDRYVDAYRAELDRQQAEYVPGPEILRLRRLRELVRQADEQRGSDPGWSGLSILEKLHLLGVDPKGPGDDSGPPGVG